MNINDFKEEDRAYGLTISTGIYTEYTIDTYVVTKKGYKYIEAAFTDNFAPSSFYLKESDNTYLTQKQQYGYPVLLFPTLESVIKYIRAADIMQWARRTFYDTALRTYSIKQILAVKNLLHPDEQTKAIADIIDKDVVWILTTGPTRDHTTWKIKTAEVKRKLDNDRICIQSNTSSKFYDDILPSDEFILNEPNDYFLTENSKRKNRRTLFATITDATKHILENKEETNHG